MRRPGGFRRALAFPAAVALAALVGGCDAVALEKTVHELQQSRQENMQLKNEVSALQDTVAGQQKQIQTLLGLGDKRLDMLFQVASLEIGRYSAGLDADGRPGDDYVRVYLRPLDADGDPVKAAGSVTIQLYDLAAAAEKNLLGTHEFDLEEVRKCWYGGVGMYNYRFECPWKSGPPPHEEVTVRAVFTDYLTGRQFTAQQVVKVRLPPSTQPGSQ